VPSVPSVSQRTKREAARRHVVLFSGGSASAMAAVRVRKRIGPSAALTLLFTDTRDEDQDLYRFLWDAARAVGGDLVIEADGRDLWQVFEDEGMIGNTRADVCSRILKREPSRRWLKANCDPATTTIYVGYGIEEPERFVRFRRAMEADGWTVDAPLLSAPLMSKPQRQAALRDLGLRLPRMYAEGFEHNNCGGACVKGGHAQWRMLLRLRPDTYARHEAAEQRFRESRGKDVAILRDRRGGETRPLTLKALRERVTSESRRQPGLFDNRDPGPAFACSCFSDVLEPVDGERDEVEAILAAALGGGAR